MAKSRERSEVEQLRADNKRLKKENNELKRRASRLEKRSHRVEDLEEMIEDMAYEQTEKFIPRNNKCPECLEGNLENVDLGVRTMTKCSKCTYRKSSKK